MKYSCDNLETMRTYIAILIDPTRESWGHEFFREYSSMIEDRLRTSIMAGIGVQNMGSEVDKILRCVRDSKTRQMSSEVLDAAGA